MDLTPCPPSSPPSLARSTDPHVWDGWIDGWMDTIIMHQSLSVCVRECACVIVLMELMVSL